MTRLALVYSKTVLLLLTCLTFWCANARRHLILHTWCRYIYFFFFLFFL